MEIAIVSEVQTSEQGRSGHTGRKGGTIRQALLGEEAADGLNFSFYRSQYQSGEKAFESPRHHHAFQQIRWTESGSVNYGPDQNIPENDLAYFPRGAFYGPQRKDEGVGLLLQFGFAGEHQSGKVWERYRGEAVERLKGRGIFENGLFIEIDPATGEKIERDAVEALYDEQYQAHTQQKFEIPPEGYDAPILMHTDAFGYYQAEPGVEIKNLGKFFEHPGPNADLNISMVRLSAGGAYHLAPERAQVAWAKGAGLKIDGRVYPELTCVYSARDEDVVLSGDDGVEVYIVEFPRLD
jgi:hypothetical protein